MNNCPESSKTTRRTPLSWFILSVFVLYSTFLPLHHLHDEMVAPCGLASGDGPNSVISELPQDHAPSDKPICEACIWAQSLHLNHDIVLVNAAGSAFAPVCLDSSRAFASDFFTSFFKRGPPVAISI